jgi:DNA polymerase-3 subunit alpha
MTAKEGEKSSKRKKGIGGDDRELVKKIREIYQGSDLRSRVLHEAERLEGSVRNTGLHAAGIIIAPEDLANIIPVCTAKDSDLLVTQIEGSIIEEAGVLKMDFLGLRTLNILKTSLNSLNKIMELPSILTSYLLTIRKHSNYISMEIPLALFSLKARVCKNTCVT